MTSRERVLTACNHREPDRVPIDFSGHPSSGIAAIAYAKLRDYLGLPKKIIRVYDPIQQLAIVDDDLMERYALMTRDVCCSSQSSVPCLKPSPESASGIDAVILNSHRTCPTRCSMKPDPCRCLSPASRTFRQTDSDFVTRRTPASSAGCRRPESSRRPVSCCRTESWSERRRNRRRPERGPPEKPPSSPPETPSQNSRRSAAGRSPGNAPSVRLHPRSPALRRNRPVPRPAHVSAERTSPAGAASRPARSPSRSCSHP